MITGLFVASTPDDQPTKAYVDSVIDDPFRVRVNNYIFDHYHVDRKDPLITFLAEVPVYVQTTTPNTPGMVTAGGQQYIHVYTQHMLYLLHRLGIRVTP